MKTLLKEPLLHFAVIGALLFGLYTIVNPGTAGGEKVVVDSGTIASLQARFERTWNRPPTEIEIQGLVDDYVVEEILYRQALAMGMDQNDPMIRRRLRQKMEFLTTDALDLYQPSEAELTQYLRDNPEKFALDPVFSFEQVYVRLDGEQDIIDNKLATIRTRLAEDGKANGDRSLMPAKFETTTAFAVDRAFGEGFAQQLRQLPLNNWGGPIRSGLGLHFIKVTHFQPDRVPALAEVRDVVQREWQSEKNAAVKTALIDTLRSQYHVVVEWPPGSSQNNGPSQNAGG